LDPRSAKRLARLFAPRFPTTKTDIHNAVVSPTKNIIRQLDRIIDELTEEFHDTPITGHSILRRISTMKEKQKMIETAKRDVQALRRALGRTSYLNTLIVMSDIELGGNEESGGNKKDDTANDSEQTKSWGVVG